MNRDPVQLILQAIDEVTYRQSAVIVIIPSGISPCLRQYVQDKLSLMPKEVRGNLVMIVDPIGINSFSVERIIHRLGHIHRKCLLLDDTSRWWSDKYEQSLIRLKYMCDVVVHQSNIINKPHDALLREPSTCNKKLTDLIL